MILFNKEALSTVNQLSRITKNRENKCPIKFEKDEEGIHVQAGNEGNTIVFTYDAPTGYFDFTGDDICFYDYPEFHRYLSAFEDPIMTTEVIDEEYESLVFTQGRRKIVYPLSDSEVVDTKRRKIKWDIPSAVFDFVDTDVTALKSILSLLGAKETNLVFSFSGETVTVKTASTMRNRSANTYEDTFALKEPVAEDFTITIKSDIFSHLNNKFNYRVEVSDIGVIRFFYDDLRYTDYIMNNMFWIGCWNGLTQEMLDYEILCLREIFVDI